jgi:hypothetical protein
MQRSSWDRVFTASATVRFLKSSSQSAPAKDRP